MKILTHIIGVDPSGAFYEGCGHSGLVLLNCIDGKMQECKQLGADKYERDVDYWQSHIDTIYSWHSRHPNTTGVAIEDYMLYGHKMQEQINSRMETCQLLGVLKFYLTNKGIPYRLQPAALVKPRWPDKILKYHKYDISQMTQHERDALRHAVHATSFYNKGEDVWLGRMIPTA